MAGRDRRGSLAASSSRSRTPEQDRWAWSRPAPTWSRPLSDGRSFKSLLRSIGVWFSSAAAAGSRKKTNRRRSEEEAAALDGNDLIVKKPPPPCNNRSPLPLPACDPASSFFSSTYLLSSLDHWSPVPAPPTGRPSARGLYISSGATRPFQSSVFSMEEILLATNNFSPALKIGQGGFGAVYKGALPDGTVVAVKRAKMRMQNPHVDVEFRSEVKVMARIEHQNLVRFYGYMECGEERIVVVEYVPNGTLREHLDRSNGRFLDFGTRLDIAIDVAHAVTYLHMYSDHPIIHRDIKSSNILLTDSLRAKVADFGFARLGAGLGGEATHVSTQVKGTAGYLDPEYLKTCHLTDRSDVYSFGVLLVELASARRPIETKRDIKERLTARWAVARLIDGAAADVLDPLLARTPAAHRALEMLLDLALRCLGPVRQDRPAMSDCCRALWAARKTYRDMLTADMTPPHPLSSASRHTTGHHI